MFCGHRIVNFSSVKLLGVTVDNCVTFREQALKVIQACNYHTHALRHIRHLITESDANAIEVSLINSRLDYCNSVLFGISNNILKQLQIAQNSAARVVTQAPYRSSTTGMLRSLHWLPVEQRIVYKIACITHAVKLHQQPEYLRDLITHYTPSRTLRSTSSNQLTVPRIRTSLAARSFSNSALKIWNSLPSCVRDSTSSDLFKKNLKTQLYSVAFSK